MIDEETIGLWTDLADQYLDGEYRDSIPSIAMSCIRAGWSRRYVQEVWRYEVTPAVWVNAWAPLPHWGYWDAAWLKNTIVGKRGRWPNQTGPVGYLVYRLRAGLMHEISVAIDRTIEVLEREPAPTQERLASMLAWLAKHYFDCFFSVHYVPTEEDCERISFDVRPLVEQTFLPIFEPLVWQSEDESRVQCHARVEFALRQIERVRQRSPYRDRAL